MSEYSRVASPFGGPARYTNPGMVALVATYCAIEDITLKQFYAIQGSFNVGVKASAGTHDEADCIDGADSLNTKILKMIGAFAWHRTVAQGFAPHVHFGRMFSTAMAWLATEQDETYREKKSNGLGNLTHVDTSWCPRYRGVEHIAGPTTQKYRATKASQGYSQPGCHPKDVTLRKLSCLRAKGYVLSDIAGTVRCNGSTYFVTTSLTFYNAANFELVKDGTPEPAKSFDTTIVTQNVIALRMSKSKPSNIADWKAGENYAARVPLMAAMLKGRGVSIVATQEAGSKTHSALMDAGLGKALGGTWDDVLYGDGWDISETVTHNQGTYTRTEKGVIGVTPVGPGNSHCFFPYAVLEHKATGIPLMVVSLHLIAGSGATHDTQRGQQIKALIPKAEKLAGAIPIIFLGDLNSYKEQGTADHVDEAFNAAGYLDAEDTPCAVVNPTYDSYNSTDNPPIRKSRQYDRAFTKTGGKITFRKREVLLHLDAKGNHVTPWPSDHQPVLFDITVKR